MFKVPEKDRISEMTNPMVGSDSSAGNNGAFKIILSGRSVAYCIVADGMGWEHVSTHIVMQGGVSRTPSWAEMCKIKGLFWDEGDCVLQYHPAKEDYVNVHPHTLHLWRPTDQEVPRPPKIMVG